MYKIYINQTPFFLVKTPNDAPVEKADEQNIIGRYTGRHRFLLQYIDMLEKTDRFQTVTLFSNELDKMIADFEEQFEYIEAAGGIIFNPKGEVLFIYRRGFWDLPKGKIDPGENPEETALREVEEETGLKNVSMIGTAPPTFHTYRLPKKEKRILKKTHWFLMKTEETEVKVQKEEDIEKGEWHLPKIFMEKKPVIYRSLMDLLGKVFSEDK